MNIQLNIDDLIEEFNLPSNTADVIVVNAVDAVTQEIYRNWSLQAQKELKSTRQEYINGLEAIVSNKFSRIIRLNGQFNNMIEKGASAFDMKEGFRKSKHVKFSTKIDKNGQLISSWYLTIPFRHGVPTTIGENPAFSNIMPKEIYALVKRKPSNQGLKKSEIPSPYDIPSSRAVIQIPKASDIPEYVHKSSIYQGMQKKTGVYGQVMQNTYISFRRVGEKSDENSWIHRGLKAHNFLQKAIASTDVDLIVENSIDETLNNLGYGK